MTWRKTDQPRPVAGDLTRRHAFMTIGVAAAAAAIGAPAAQAETMSPVLVELFTSQGCSSCPPADALLGELVGNPDIIALSFNVDYWDYLGWKDSLAKPAYGERQRDYARSHKERTVYTPQMVIAGRKGVVGSREDQVRSAIDAERETPPHARIALSTANGALKIRVMPASAVPMPCNVMVAAYTKRVEQRIQRGENRGRSIVYHNAVRTLSSLGEWAGSGEKELSLPLVEGADGYAVFLQSGDGGPVLAAAKLEP